MSTEAPATAGFSAFELPEPVLRAVVAAGYTEPTPIQSQAIPPLLAGRDVVGQAQTGTGKTAAFALPLLSQIDLKNRRPQVLVLMPTRELAMQVSEAFQTYAKYLPGLEILSVYGGQHFKPQLLRLGRGVHVVVGTPGRVMDHMRRGSLKLDGLQTLVLDEADEMLRMGFIDDVEWVLENSPDTRRIALFSATMPAPIRKIAERHLNEPHMIAIQSRARAAETVQQRALQVDSRRRVDALCRILAAEPSDGIIVFVRTRGQTSEVAEALEARGLRASYLNGDMAQGAREKAVDRLRRGQLDILVATDVAARGLDVRRVSHVINYDIPSEVEAYVHRIGRTGRAGNTGQAILFVTPRDRRMLSVIERTTQQSIQRMTLPTIAAINKRRLALYKERITETLSQDLSFHRQVLEEYCRETGTSGPEVAAALSLMAQGKEPLQLPEPTPQERARETRPRDTRSREPRSRDERPRRQDRPSRDEMQQYRVEVGREHDVAAGNLVGAIANVSGLDGQFIGRINIRDSYSLVELPEGMPADIFELLSNAKVLGQELRISKVEGQPASRGPSRPTTKPAENRVSRTGKVPESRRAGGADSPRRAGKAPEARRAGGAISPRRAGKAPERRGAGGKAPSRQTAKRKPAAKAQGGMSPPTRRPSTAKATGGKAGGKMRKTVGKAAKAGKKKSSHRS